MAEKCKVTECLKLELTDQVLPLLFYQCLVQHVHLLILELEKDSRSPVCRVLCQGLGAFSIPCLITFPSNSLPKDDSALGTDYKDSLGYRLWKNWKVRLISPRIASGGERSLNLSLWWLNWRNGHITLHLPRERETHILQRTGMLAPWE